MTPTNPEPNHISPAQLDLLARYRAGDLKAGTQLVEEYAPLVGNIAAKFPSRLDYEEKFHVGNIGFLEALVRYDERKAALPTYAKFWIEKAIREASRKAEFLVHVPENVDDARIKIIQTITKLEAEHKKAATLETVAAASGLKEALITRIVGLYDLTLEGCPQSAMPMYDLSAWEDASTNLASEAPTPFEAVAHRDSIEVMKLKLSQLNREDQSIISIQFGMGAEAREDNSFLNYPELGARLGCSGWVAGCRAKRAIARLRQMMEER